MKHLFGLIILSISLISNAQLGNRLKAFKDKLEDSGTGITKKLADTKTVQNMREKQNKKDTATFNFSVALIDNTSFFRSKNNKQNFALTALKTTDGTDQLDLSRAEKAFEFNRNASALFKVRRYKPALLRYYQALALYSDEEITDENKYEFLSSKRYDKELITEYESLTGLSDMDHFAISHTYNNLSIVCLFKGNITLAESYATAAYDIRKKHLGNSHVALASSLNNVASILKEQGDFFNAEIKLKESLKILKSNRLQNHVYYAIVKNNLGTLQQLLGDYDEAENSYRTAISIAENFNDDQNLFQKNKEIINFETNYAILLFVKGDIEKADKTFQEALKKTGQVFGRRSPEYAYLINNYASVKVAEKKLNEAEEDVKVALDIYEAKFGTRHHTYAKTKMHLAKIYYYKGEYQKAKNTIHAAAPVLKTTVGKNHPERLSYLSDYALVLWKNYEFEQARKTFNKLLKSSLDVANEYFQYMTENERSKFWTILRARLMDYYAFCAEQNAPDLLKDMYTTHCKTKGLILASTQNIRNQVMSSNDQKLMKTYKDWQQIKEELAVYLSWPNDRLVEEQINVDSLELRASKLEEQLSMKVEIISTVNEKANFDEVRSNLNDVEAAVEIIRVNSQNTALSDQYVVLIASKRHPYPTLIQLKNAKELEGKFFTYYFNAIQNNVSSTVPYDAYWKEVNVSTSKYKTLYVSVDGVYSKVNLNTLQPSDDQYLVSQQSIQYISNTSEIASLKKYKQVQLSKVHLFGGAHYGNRGKVAPLPGTAIEVKSISSTLKSKGFRSTLYLDKNVTEAKVKAVKSPTVLHIATHGFFEDESRLSNKKSLYGLPVSAVKDNPLLRSGLFLVDAENAMDATTGFSDNNNGILLAYEIANNMTLDKTDIVILSACETARGEVQNGEGVYGLQRAFQLAGARSLLMSLWKVNDEATKDLMIAFYKELIITKDKYKAFRNAQLKIKEKYPDPINWGGFVLKG